MDKSVLMRRRLANWQKAGVSILFLLPAIAMMIFSVYIPFAWNGVLSFQKWNGFKAATWVGFDNYKNLLTDKIAQHSLWNSIFLAVFSTLGAVILGLLLAAFIFKVTEKEGAIYRLILFLPVMLPTAVVGLLFAFVFNPEMGLLNNLLKSIGLGSLATVWLENKGTVMWCIVAVNIWKMSGLTMMLSFASMKMLPESIFESSKLEGATYKHQYIRLILPLIKPTVLMSAVYTLVVNFKSFDIVFVLTRGGPGTVSQTVPINMVKTAFNFSEFGYAAAMGLVFALVVMLVVTIVNKVLKGERYEY